MVERGGAPVITHNPGYPRIVVQLEIRFVVFLRYEVIE